MVINIGIVVLYEQKCASFNFNFLILLSSTMANYWTGLLILVAICLVDFSTSQLESPCPELFKYDTNSSEPGRWFGTMILKTDSELRGVWMRAVFDKRPLQIGNWIGKVETRENNEYLIKNKFLTLQPNKPVEVRIFARYNPEEAPPKLTGFRLNAKTVCPEGGSAANSENTEQSPINEDDPVFLSQDETLYSTCGAVVEPPKDYTPDNQATYHGEFPWHVALYQVKGSDLVYSCAGSLISENHVITSAKCVRDEDRNPTKWVAYLGKQNLNQWSNSDIIQARSPSKINLSSEVDPQVSDGRIVILELSSPIEVTDFVRPICLTETDGVNTKAGIVADWGYDQSGKRTSELKKANLEITSHDPCVAVYEKGTTICDGDIGGGIVASKAISGSSTKEWQLRGVITSSSVENRTCDTQSNIIFTDINKHINWIRDILK